MVSIFLINMIRFLILIFLITFCVSVFAATGSGAGLPYEGWFQTLQDSLTGPVAGVIVVLAIFGAGAMLIFGGQINDFLKTVIMIILAAAFLLAGASIVSGLFGGGVVVI